MSDHVGIEIKGPAIQRVVVQLVGTSELMCHAWSEKAKKPMLDKHRKTATGGTEARVRLRENGMGTMVYEFQKGARIPGGVSASETREELEAIRQRRGALTAEHVARAVEDDPHGHPLRWAFTWDARAAIHKCHVQQAGHLIRCVAVKHLTPFQAEPVRAYVVVRAAAEAPERHAYEPMSVVLQRPDLRAHLLEQIEDEFSAAERKRRALIALLAVRAGRGRPGAAGTQ